MNALQKLANEHGLVRQYLDNLALAAERIENGVNPPREFFEVAVEFARTFTDRFHHYKEEHLMFTRLAEKHSGAIDAQIERLRQQHERGRNLVNDIASSLDGYAEGDSFKIDKVLENTAAYTSLLRRHIHTEDHIFYPMVEREFTPEEMDSLLSEFLKAESDSADKTFQECHKMVVDMGSILVHL